MGHFKRYDGYVMHIPQEFIDSKLPVCPFCKSDHPHWLLDSRMEMSLAGSRTYYQCECCHAILSSTAADANAEKGKGFAINPAMAALNAAHKGTKHQEVGVAYMRVDDLGTVCKDTSLLGREFPITYFQELITPATVICPDCGKMLTAEDTFCRSCGARLTPPAPVQVFCTRCGAPLTPGDVFCGSCGTKVSASAPTPAPVETPAPAPAFAAAEEPHFAAAAPEETCAPPVTAPAPESALAQGSPRLPIVPLILMGLASLYSLIGLLGSFHYIPYVLTNLLELSAVTLPFIGLLLCKGKRNPLFGIGFLLMATVPWWSVLFNTFGYTYFAWWSFLLFSVPISVLSALIGIFYLKATPGTKTPKLVFAILIMSLEFISAFLFMAIYDFFSWAPLNAMFEVVAPMLAAILYTPYTQRS